MNTKRYWQRASLGIGSGLVVAAVVLLVWAGNLFNHIRLQLTNIYFVPLDVSDNIVIVAIDDASLARFGRSPTEWSRTTYARLTDILAGAGTRVVAFDLLFSEATTADYVFGQALERARQSASGTRVVMAVAGIQPAVPASLDESLYALRFDNVLRPTSQLAQHADYLGYTNTFPDLDGQVRRQPSVIAVDTEVGYAWSLAIYLAYLRVPGSAASQLIQSEAPGVLQVTPARRLFVDDLGFWLQDFFGPPQAPTTHTFQIISLLDVVSGEIDPSQLAGKIALVGVINSAGIADQYPVPSAAQGQLMSGIEIQANAVETLLQAHALHTQGDLSQAVFIFVLALCSGILYRFIPWYFRWAVWLVSLLGLVGFGSITFTQSQEITNLFDPALALTLAALASIGIDISEEIRRRQQTEFLLRSVVQVSEQQLILAKIMPLIAEDIHRILAHDRLIFWRWDKERQALTQIYPGPAAQDEHNPHLLAEAVQVSQTRTPSLSVNQAVLPILWRQRLVGVYAVYATDGKKLTRRALSLLQKLAVQIAPSLENAILYTDLKEQTAIQSAILSGSPAGILVLDQTLNIRLLSRFFEDVLEVDSKFYLDHPLPELLSQIGLEQDRQQEIGRHLKQQSSFRLEVSVGKQSFELTASQLEFFGLWVLILTEVTHLVELSELKTYIIRMLSHDLGNPLARVLGYCRLIYDDRAVLNEMHQQFLEYILQDGQEMDRIINDVLNLEHIRSVQPAQEKVDFQQLVAALVSRHEPEMRLSGHTCSSEIYPEPLFVLGNHREFSQAVSNLLTNAVKYTPNGGTISIRLQPEADKHVRLSVQDSGYGIPKEAQSKLFTAFYRVRTPATAAVSGTGLGLNLVKVVVEKHAGRVWFESEEGVGSIFYLELPIFVESNTV